MPEIPLMSRGKPVGPAGAYLVLQSIMWSPKDMDSVMSYLVSLLVAAFPRNYTRKQRRIFRKHHLAVEIAGEIFLHLLQLTKCESSEDASIGKAVFIVSRDLEQRRLPSGRKAPSNVDRIHRFWADFRPAAHLWAAFRIYKDADRIPRLPGASPQELETFS